ncbi:hypothetical protein [Amaricoccus tamworthensis]|uniref:hypothetical protein n=1 Tax=Amaricoccus tamworthensis TaxID=57002 RepID=UPI003C7E0D5E
MIWTVLPVAPLILSFVALDMLYADGFRELFQSLGIERYFPSHGDVRFFNSLIVYVSIGLFHLMACLVVMAMMARFIQRMDETIRRRTWVVLAVSILILGLLNIMARQAAFDGPLNLTYRSICSIIQPSNVAEHILPGGCTEPGLSMFAWFAVLPYVFGLVAAAFASAAISTVGDPLKEEVTDSSDEIHNRMHLIETAFQATVFVLVTSTLSLMLFYQLPLSVVEDDTSRTLISGFAQGMTMFWGMVFTLTLIAIFGPAHLLLRHRVHSGGQAEVPQTLGGESLRKRLSRILAVLAPLLLGSSASLVDLISSAL